MKLTDKDKEFLDSLRRLMESKDLWVEFRAGHPSYMVLRGTYGQAVHKAFRMTRQGVRWRFHRLFNDVYVSAFETILFLEKTFGTGLRDHAIRISRERYTLHQEISSSGFRGADILGGQQAQQDARGAANKPSKAGDAD
jgi:hypothetical protein